MKNMEDIFFKDGIPVPKSDSIIQKLNYFESSIELLKKGALKEAEVQL